MIHPAVIASPPGAGNPTSAYHLLGRAARTAGSRPKAASNPPSVLRGVKNHRASLIDWMRFSGPRDLLDRAVRVMEDFFGPGMRRDGKFFLAHGIAHGSGGIFYDDDHAHVVVDVPGALRGLLDHHDRIALLDAFVSLGFKGTRIDVAVDFHGCGTELIDNVGASCKAR